MDSKEYWIKWIKAAGIRAIKTAAQVGVILMGTETISITSLNWIEILGCMASGAVLSLLTSLAGIPEVKTPEE